MRVATRRQRAAWRVFGDGFRDKRTRRYRRGLREIAGRLGAVRDLDVQLETADAYRADLPVAEQRALEPLLASWRGHRDDARVLLLRELDSDRYRRWLDDYLDFVRTEGLPSTRSARPPRIGSATPRRRGSGRPTRTCAAYESVLRWADVETLHDLRIAGKWLRYSLEFVREALGPGREPAHRPRRRAAGPHRADARRRPRRVAGADVPRRPWHRAEHPGDRGDRSLPRRSRARDGTAASDDRTAVAAASSGRCSGVVSGGWSPGSRPSGSVRCASRARAA